ncbi:hypothetical protein HDU78_002295 [Chytriomyces hyalinus]|nr:hypothetical protein HDU78_002295 [Chytriomyces hyalinus]
MDPTVKKVENRAIDDEKQAEIDRILKAHAEKPVSDFMKAKLIAEAPKNWDLFYKRNTTNFFKDRHWTWREFPELVESETWATGARLLEVGCGVGNFVWPLLEQNKAMFIYACDFSTRAVNFVKENESYTEERMKAFVCDLTANPITENVPAASLDFVTAIFCLSAIPPSKLEYAVQNIASVLKSGGVVLFRDYGLYDEAELRFKPGHMMDDHFYMRQDGTFSVYFSLEQIEKLFVDAGFAVEENCYVTKEVENRKREIKMERIWVQSKEQHRKSSTPAFPAHPDSVSAPTTIPTLSVPETTSSYSPAALTHLQAQPPIHSQQQANLFRSIPQKQQPVINLQASHVRTVGIEMADSDNQAQQRSDSEGVYPVAPYRTTGYVKFFNSQKGYGFIIPAEGELEVFVHHTAILRPDGGFRSLAEGENVEFDLIQGPKGLQAANVTGPGGATVIGDPQAFMTTVANRPGGMSGMVYPQMMGMYSRNGPQYPPQEGSSISVFLFAWL